MFEKISLGTLDSPNIAVLSLKVQFVNSSQPFQNKSKEPLLKWYFVKRAKDPMQKYCILLVSTLCNSID